jgi:hypothetical protein
MLVCSIASDLRGIYFCRMYGGTDYNSYEDYDLRVYILHVVLILYTWRRFS